MPSRLLKIGVLTHIRYPIIEPFAGGLEAFTYDITSRLRAHGHDVTLFAAGGSAPELRVERMDISSGIRSDAKRHDHDSLSSGFIAEHHAYMSCMQRIDGYHFDVILNSSLHYVPVTMAGLISTPMLTILHTPPFFELINAIAARQKRESGFYTTVSLANASTWSDLVPQCAVIPNGIDLDFWRPASGHINDHAFWYGRLVPDKGAHTALDAVRDAGMTIRIAGRCEDQSYFEREIAQRLGPRATYLGHLDRNELVGEIGHSAVCVVTPCWDEPFGLVVAESFACGTPVVAFARGALPELVTAETGILVEPGNVTALAAALVRSHTLDRQACRLRAEKLWSLDLMTSRYEARLDEISIKACVDA